MLADRLLAERASRFLARRTGARSAESFRSFVTRIHPRFEWYRHCEVLARVIDRLVAGELNRVMVFMPPRHGKSEVFSRLLPAYYLSRHPDRFVGITSYTAELAYTFSRASREHHLDNVNGALRGESMAVRHWETGRGGGLFAAGVGGPITGKGMHLGIIDDPVKNAEAAASPIVQVAHQEWYQSTLYTRLEPGAALALMMTRWDENDLGGYLLQQEHLTGSEGWHVVWFPAIKDSSIVVQWPPTCTIEPDWREDGEALCPERYPVEALERIRKASLESYWTALYQGVPNSTIGKGRVYRNFDGKNIWEGAKDNGGDVLVGMDFNVNPMTAIIASRASDQLHIFDELMLSDSGTEEMARALKARFPGRRIKVYPDPAGRQRRTSAAVGATDFAILQSHGFTILASPTAPPVVDRVNEVNAMFGDPGETGRAFVHPRCKVLIHCLSKQTYRPGTNEPAKGQLDHAPDALGYLIHQEFPMVSRRWTRQESPI